MTEDSQNKEGARDALVGSPCSAYISDKEARRMAAKMLPEPDRDWMEMYAKEWVQMNATRIARALVGRLSEDKMTRSQMLAGIKELAATQWPDERMPVWAARVGANFDPHRRKWFLPNKGIS
jgi:hypothetical protein